jgi:hypothetical protein
LTRDHPEYKSFPGQLSGCQVSANCPYEWSKDIVGHGTHVAGELLVYLLLRRSSELRMWLLYVSLESGCIHAATAVQWASTAVAGDV